MLLGRNYTNHGNRKPAIKFIYILGIEPDFFHTYWLPAVQHKGYEHNGESSWVEAAWQRPDKM